MVYLNCRYSYVPSVLSGLPTLKTSSDLQVLSPKNVGSGTLDFS